MLWIEWLQMYSGNLGNAPIQDVKLECGLKMNATLESSSSACVSSSVNFTDDDNDEKYSSTNHFHGQKLNENKKKVRYNDEGCDEI